MIWALNAYALGWLATWLVLLRNFARAGRRPTDARDAVLLATVWPLVWPTVVLIVLGERVMTWLRPVERIAAAHASDDESEVP